jgi:nucleoside phosphorylase
MNGTVDAVLHVGLAGSRRDCGIAVGELVVGADAFYEDLVTTRRLSPDVVAADPMLVRAACDVLSVEPLRIGTTGRVGGASSCLVEAMEGFAVLRACELSSVPAVEVRAISNHIDDSRADWRMDEALVALGQALPRLVASITAAVSASP